MADRKNFFFEQRVAQAELDDAYADLENAEFNIKKDAFSGVGFLMSPVTVTEDSPQSTSVLVGDFLGWDSLGQRVEKAAGPTAFSFAGDDNPGLVTPSRLYIKFARLESDPRTDGNGNSVNFEQEESYVIERDLGTPGGANAALRVDESIHIADVNIPAAAGVITNGDITIVQNLQSQFPVARLKDMSQGMDDAMVAAVAAAPSTANRVALLSDAGVSQLRGYISNVKLVALSGTIVDVESAIAVNADGVLPPGGAPDTLMTVKNAPIDVTAPNGPGGLDVGVIADGVYYVYLIGDSTGVTAPDVMASLDAGPGYGGIGPSFANAPNHDRFRLIGVINRQAGTIIPFRQIGEEYIYDDTQQTLAFPSGLDPHAGVAPTPYILLSLSPYVTPIAERAYLHFDLGTLAITGPMYGFRSRGGGAGAGRTVLVGGGAGGSLSNNSNTHFEIHVDGAQAVDWNRERLAVAVNHIVEVLVAGMHLDLKYE
jgi:hypothetical protein